MRRLSRLDYKWLVGIVFMFGLFMDLMDSTVVNVALPRLSQDFHASTAAVEWTVTGYLLSLAVFIPGSGFLADRFGTKRTFLLAMGVFVVGSALCGQAQSLPQLVAFRFLQGVGGGMMTPVSTAILSREFPGEERAKASALISVPGVLAPVTGPVIGGYLVQYASWRWIFYINLPIGIIGLLLAFKVLREHREPYAQGRFDLIGLALGGAGASMLLYALAEAGTHDWTSTTVTGWGLGGLVVLALFVLRELRISYPMLDVRIFSGYYFRLGSVINASAFATFSGTIFLLALFLQELQGHSPVHAGLIQAPGALGTAVTLPLAGRYYARLGPRKMCIIGFAGGALLMVPYLWFDKSTPSLLITLVLFARGMPIPMAMVASQVLIYGPLPGSKQGPASSIYSTLRQVAASFGVALSATILVSRTSSHLTDALAAAHLSKPTQAMQDHAMAMGFHEAFLVTGILLLFSCLLSFMINDARARALMMTHGTRRVSLEEEPARLAPGKEPEEAIGGIEAS